MNDSKEAIDIIKSEDFDVILLDLAMPDFSGIDIVNSLKEDNLLEKKRIVILTASSVDDENIKEFMHIGIKAVLKKPLSLEELTDVLEKFGHP